MSGAGATLEPLSIDVVSDVVCPWCYIGKRRLDQAIAASGVPVAIRWRPYQLDRTIPPEGKSRRDYMAEKFGSPERIRQIHARLEAAGEPEGIAFKFDRIAVSPNTLDAHRLIRWAGEAGSQDAVVEALFRAYFLDGADIGRSETLAGIAENAGMDRKAVTAGLASAEGCPEVKAEVEAARQIGVTGVPTFVVDGRYAVVGAQPAQTLADALRTVYAQSKGMQIGASA